MRNDNLAYKAFSISFLFRQIRVTNEGKNKRIKFGTVQNSTLRSILTLMAHKIFRL